MIFVGGAFATEAPFDVNSPKTIKSEKIEYDVKTGTVKTRGKTEITNAAGQRMTLRDSYLSGRGEQLSGDDVKIWLGQHVYIESDNVTRNGADTIARNAMFTACAGCDSFGNAWEINATKIVHDMDDRMLSFHNMVFNIYDIPVLYFPYYTMPDPAVKHKSGLLIPTLQSTNKMGAQINQPLYLSFSDTHDATFTLSYLTRENPLFQLEHRLNLAHSEYRTRGSYTHNRAGENRWHIFNNDIIEMGEYARASIFIERASDKTYLQKYGFYEDQPYLDSGAKVELFGQSSYAVADAHIFQELRSDYVGTIPSGNILPNVRGVYQTKPLFAETYMTLSGDVLSVVDKGTSSQRMIGESRITSPWTMFGGNRLTVSVAARYDVYNFHNTDMIDGDKFSGVKNRFLPNGYVEWGVPFVKPGVGWSQTIEPRARLTVMRRADEDQFALNNDSAGTFLSDTVLFSNNRFAGYDLWENGTFADYGARWAAFNSDGRTVEVFFGQSYDFTDIAAGTDPNSGFHKGGSDYVGRIGFNNSDWLDISSRFRFNRDSFNLHHAETSAVIGSSANYFTIGHIWARQFLDAQTLAPDINEAMAGVGFQITDRWSMKFEAIYNWTESTFLRHMGTLFYNHPCYYMSFGYRRDNAVREDYQGNTTFQFRFGISIEGQKY